MDMVIHKSNCLMWTGASGNISKEGRTEARIWGIVIIWTWFDLGCSACKKYFTDDLVVPLKQASNL